jgi:hypothetical protein
MKTAYELFHKKHPDQAATDSRGTYDTLAEAAAATDRSAAWNPDAGLTSWRAETGPADHWLILSTPIPENDGERIALALDLIRSYGRTDGDDHQAWVIDQLVRYLAEDYEAWITEYRAGEDGPETYSWDEGIAP